MSVKRLYRSEKQRIIAGVAGGVAEYFQIDVTFVRIAFLAATVLWGFGAGLYLIMWLLMPAESNLSSEGSQTLSKNVEEMRESAKQASEFVRGKVDEVAKSKAAEDAVDAVQDAGEAVKDQVEKVTKKVKK